MNAKLLLSVTDDAERVYRERFLRERYGLPVHDVSLGSPASSQDADIIDVAELFGDEVDKQDDAGEELADT